MQLVEIILADVLSCIYDSRFLAFEPCETTAQRIDNCFRMGTAIATMLTPEMMLMTECDFGERT